MKDVRSVATIETVIRDTVILHEEEATADTCLTYSDEWADFTVCRGGGLPTIAYAVRDSVQTFVYVSYCRRFLWWRWEPAV